MTAVRAHQSQREREIMVHELRANGAIVENYHIAHTSKFGSHMEIYISAGTLIILGATVMIHARSIKS